MSLNELRDDEIRDAFAPFEVDPNLFDETVKQIATGLDTRRPESPSEDLPHWQRQVASCLPLSILSGSKGLAAPVTASSTAGGFFASLMSTLALPALSIFVFLGSTIASRRLTRSALPRAESDQDFLEIKERFEAWSRRQRRYGWVLLVGFFVLPHLTNRTLVTAILLGSFILLVLVLRSLARSRLLQPDVLGIVLGSGLLYSSLAMSTTRADFHLLHPFFSPFILFAGALFVLFSNLNSRAPGPHWPTWQRWILTGVFSGIGLLLMGFVLLIQLPTHALPFRSLESELARYSGDPDLGINTAKWLQWERIMHSAQSLKLKVEVAAFETQLADVIERSDEILVSPYLWSVASRLGLLDQYWDENMRAQALGEFDRLLRFSGSEPTIRSADEWAIRELVSRSLLNRERIDELEALLLRALPDPGRTAEKATYNALERVWTVVSLLDVIDRPLGAAAKRDVRQWLTRSWTKRRSGFSPGGGFKRDPNAPACDLESTWVAVQLIEKFGIPKAIDTTWLRSYLKPWNHTLRERSLLAELTRRQFEEVEDLAPIDALDLASSEINLLLSLALVGLCLYVRALARRSNRSDRLE